MIRAARIKPISYLKANAAEVLRDLAAVREPMIITQNGEAKAVIQDIHSYEETQETLALLKIIALGERASKPGEPSRRAKCSKSCGTVALERA